MNLAHAGTSPRPSADFSGKLYTIVPYGVRKEDERIDYDAPTRSGRRAQAKNDHRRRQRVPRVIDFAAHPRGGRCNGAAVLTDMAHIAASLRPACASSAS